MLNRLEALLDAPLRAALGNGATLLFGSADQPPGGTRAQLALRALQLERVPAAAGAADEVPREAARAVTLLQPNADAADPRLFLLPPGAAERVTEVQSPPGRLLAQADAWVVDNAGLRLQQPPAGPVRVTLRGDAVRGYQERWPARLDLELVAWADSADAASELLGLGLGSVFGTLFELDLVDLQPAAAQGGLALRLLKPVAQLQGISRRSARIGNVDWQAMTAQLRVQGELELQLALGAPDPAATIARVEFVLDRLRADGTTGRDSGSVRKP